MNFYDVLAAEKWGGGIPTINFFDLLFAQSISGKQWQVYEGTLPATLNANGDDMRQYQVWGAAGGVGDRTVQLFDKNATDTDNGYIAGAGLKSDGTLLRNNSVNVSEYIPISGNTVYILRYGLESGYYDAFSACFYDISKNFISGISYSKQNPKLFTTPAAAAYARFSFSRTDVNAVVLAKGSTIPEPLPPYGYKLDMVSRTRNLLEITQDMYNPENWDLADPYQGTVYFMYYRLPQKVIEHLQNTGTIAGTVYLKPNGSYDGEVLAITNLKGGEGTRPITDDYRLLTKNGKTLNFSKNVSTWSDIYLALGLSGGIPQDKRILIDYLFQNYNIMLNEGSIALPYEPYSNTTTPIYIGDDPLGEDEYVDYQAGKVYRMIDSTLTPTDPPVPLPALPTCEGTTVIDYAGQSVAPEKVVFEYKKGI